MASANKHGGDLSTPLLSAVGEEATSPHDYSTAASSESPLSSAPPSSQIHPSLSVNELHDGVAAVVGSSTRNGGSEGAESPSSPSIDRALLHEDAQHGAIMRRVHHDTKREQLDDANLVNATTGVRFAIDSNDNDVSPLSNMDGMVTARTSSTNTTASTEGLLPLVEPLRKTRNDPGSIFREDNTYLNPHVLAPVMRARSVWEFAGTDLDIDHHQSKCCTNGCVPFPYLCINE
jgi:hypothetical protein